MESDKPNVHLLATGGTIANPRDTEGYLPGKQLLEEVPEVAEVADVSATDVSSVGSQELTPEIWYELHDRIMERAEGANPPDGFVITHGSNSLEETAYFLNLTLSTEIPVVLTAAQRNHRLIGNDGDRNLLDSVKVAASEEARGRGALIVLNDEIHHARDVTKTVSGRPDAWSSGNLGVLGLIDKRDNMKFYREVQSQTAPDTEFKIGDVDPNQFPTVEILYSYTNANGNLVRAASEYADGIVLASFPTGAPANPAGKAGQASALQEVMDDGLPVVLSHRGFEGWPYPDEPFIWGNTLTPQKARILLALGLLQTDQREELQKMFDKY